MTNDWITRETLPDSPDWRDEAINACLEHRDNDGEPSPYSLLHYVRRCRKGCHTLSLYLERPQLLRYLYEQAQDVRSLLPGGSVTLHKGQPCPYLAWFAFRWQETELELILAPSGGTHGLAFVVGDDEAQVLAFARQGQEYANRPAGRCLVYTRQWESAPDMDADIGSVTWNDVILPPNVLTGVREAVEGFIRHRKAYDTLGFAWRRGLLLVGPPGTGKTMLCKAAAAALPDLPFLYVREMTQSAGNHYGAIHTVFERARELSPCLLAFEDIDSLVTSSNRSQFLNELDGFQNNNGLLIIASSNHPGKIDEALLKRPSRFDRVFHIGLPALTERRAYCLQILSRTTLSEQMSPDLDTAKLAQQAAERTDGFTPAYLKEAFVSAALKQAQNGADVLDARFAASVLEQIEELRAYLQQVKDPDAMGEFLNPEASPIGIRRERG